MKWMYGTAVSISSSATDVSDAPTTTIRVLLTIFGSEISLRVRKKRGEEGGGGGGGAPRSPQISDSTSAGMATCQIRKVGSRRPLWWWRL